MHETQLHHTIDRLLEEIDQQRSQEPSSNEGEPDASTEQEPTIFVDMHIYHLPPGTEQESPSVESTLAEPTQNEPTHQDEQEPVDQTLTTAPPPRYRLRRPVLIVLVALCVCFTIGGSVLYLLPLITPSATVTIVPVSEQ